VDLLDVCRLSLLSIHILLCLVNVRDILIISPQYAFHKVFVELHRAVLGGRSWVLVDRSIKKRARKRSENY